MIAECPENTKDIRNTTLEEKCLTHITQKINLLSVSLDVLVPVSTPDNLTYANAYCALCHGEREFEYWSIRVKNLPSCLSGKIIGNLTSFTSFSEMTSDPDCPPIVDIEPIPPGRMKFWMKGQIQKPTANRYSKFCFDENQVPKCNQSSENATIKSNTCDHKEIQRFGICLKSFETFPCTKCSDKFHRANECLERFDSAFFKQTFLESPTGFFTPTLLIQISSPYMSSIYIGLGVLERNVELQCNSSNTNCIFPNPLSGECQIMPCPIMESCSNNSCPNFSSVLEARLSSERNIATKSLIASIIALIFTILLYKVIPELQSNYAHFQLNCFFMHLASNLCMFISSNINSCKPFCYIAALLLHFSLLSSFTWMMMTGFIIFHAFQSLNQQISSAILSQSNRGSPYKKFAAYVVGHAMPALFVVFCAVTDSWIQPGSMGYGGNSFCWIQSPKGLFATFIIPTSIIFSGNIIIFIGCGIYLIMFHYHSGSLPTVKKKQRLVMFAMFKLVIGLGIQWLFGIILHFHPDNDALRYAFIVSVSVHGILIFMGTIMLNVVCRRIIGSCKMVVEKVKTISSGSTS